MWRTGKGWVALLLSAALLPSLALATEEADLTARIKALEERVATLEARVEALAEGAQEESAEAEAQRFAMGESLQIESGPAITIAAYETGTRFRYAPASGISALSITAKDGYRLLCVYITVDNTERCEVNTAQLLDSTVCYGKEYTNKAQETFFYRKNGNYASGLKTIEPGATIEGCLLFAVPDTFDDSSESAVFRLSYGGNVYECVLRMTGSMPMATEATKTGY